MTEAQQPLPGISWFDIPDPNSPALDELAERLHLHELQIEDCRHRPQRAKTDEYGKYIFSILKHAQQTGDELEFGDLDIFLGKTSSSPCTGGIAQRFVSCNKSRSKTRSPASISCSIAW